MFSEKDLVARSTEDMAHEVEELLADAKRLREECEAATKKEVELRRLSVDTRPSDAEKAESLWQEAEQLREEFKEMMQLSMEKTLRAAEVQHRIDVHDLIESMDNSDEIWSEAAKARR
jgi:cell division septum initiation protein DivIVA